MKIHAETGFNLLNHCTLSDLKAASLAAYHHLKNALLLVNNQQQG
ncbi:hypothetical protein [Psychromonas sp. MB-3u-54]|nr:hypothetical protein [Psychromonas sp. MB-3u-54]